MAKEKRKSIYACKAILLQPYRRLYNGLRTLHGELIVLAQPLVFLHDLIHLLVEFGGGKYQRYKWLKWHNTVVS